MNLEKLIRPNIRALAPYKSARHDHSAGILLDANENSLGSVLSTNSTALNRYPDPRQLQLRSRLGEVNGVDLKRVFVGVGSDEVIDLLLRIFCRPDTDRVLLLEPTYGMYRVSASIQDASVDSALLTDDFNIDRSATVKELHSDTKLIFCCSPNNPTGNILRAEDILWLCSVAPGMVVVDEAYIDFADTPSLTRSVSATPNLIVLRTLSKAWGLAAIRLGYCVADPSVVEYLMKVKSPYNINALTEHATLEALSLQGVRDSFVARIRSERERVMRELRSVRCVREVLPTDANFFLIRCADPKLVYRHLLAQGIVVRDRSNEPKLNGCLRITVGTPEENDALLSAIREIEIQ